MDMLAHDNWDQHWEQFGKSSEIGPTPRYRRRLITSLFDFKPPGASIKFLEIGSGTGEFAQDFCQLYPEASYLGLELSQTGVAIAQRRVPKAHFVQRNLMQPTVSGELKYNATHALCSEVLEHLDDPSTLLRHSGECCAAGCRLIVTVPGGPMNAFYKHIGHRRHYSPSQLAAQLERSGFEVESAFGAGFPFFNIFRALLAMRGAKVVSDTSGSPSAMVKIGSVIFDALFRLNSRRSGWQTIAVARYLG
jgi:SAM-dependent methyltransferase